MKAISLWQPWASAIAVGAKRYETRSWPAVAGGTLYSGWLAICASKRTKEPKKDGGRPLYEVMMDVLVRAPGSVARFEKMGLTTVGSHAVSGDYFIVNSENLPLGCVVAVAWLKACHNTQGLQITIEERAWGNYSPGRFAWEFSEVWRLNTPLPVRGEQKLFNVAMPANWQDQATKVF